MKSKAKTITKLKRSLRAISPVLSVLMMIAIAVAASLVAYAWIMGYIGGTTSKVGKAIQIPSYYTNPGGTELYVYVQNVGQGTVEFDGSACVYINDVGISASISPATSLEEGSTGTFTVTGLSLDVNSLVKIKVVTRDGTFMEVKGLPYVGEGGANHAPVLASIGGKSVDEGTLLTFDADASDPDATDTLTFSLVSAPTGASIDPVTGVFTWTPTEDQGPADYTFKVRVTDNGVPALYDEEEITVTVTEGNQPPELAAIGNKGVNELEELSFTATATDADLPAQTMTFSLDAGFPTGASITSGGVFTWTPTEAQGPGSYPVTVIVSDGLAQDSEAITVTVSEGNQAPVLDGIGNKAVNEGSALSFTATASDVDVPAQTLTFSLGPGYPTGASITSGGAFTWTPTEAQGPGSYPVTVIVSDGSAQDSELITVTVNEVNQAPVLTPIGNKNGNEMVALTFTATATDADLPAQTLTFSFAPGYPTGASITAGGAFTWTPTEAQGPGSYPVTVQVSDGTAQDSETITVTVNEVNLAPVLDAISDTTIDELTTLTIDANANDADLPANTLTYSLTGTPPTGASINPSTGVFTWTPSEAQGPGDYDITVRVTDNGVPALTDDEAFHVHVNEVASPPQTITQSPTSYSDSGWSSENSAYSNGGGSALSDYNSEWIIYGGYGFAIPSGATNIQVRVRLDVWVESGGNDDVHLEVYDGSWHIYSPDPIQLPDSETTIWCVVTSLSSGGWTPSEVNSIQVRVTHDQEGSGANDIYLDWIPIEVTYTP